MSICCWHCPGIPTLVLADEENKIISYNARFVVANDVEGKVWASATCLYLLTYLPTYLLTETLWLYTNHLTPVISVKKKTFILLKNYYEVNNKCWVLQDFPWKQKPVDELTEANCVALHEAAALIYFTGMLHNYLLFHCLWLHSHWHEYEYMSEYRRVKLVWVECSQSLVQAQMSVFCRHKNWVILVKYVLCLGKVYFTIAGNVVHSCWHKNCVISLLHVV